MRTDYVNERMDPSGFVLLADFVPQIVQEIRYYSTYNFIGDRIDGYEEPCALLTREAARQLKSVAGEMLGLRMTYLEAGSGALNPVPDKMVTAVRRCTKSPLIVGGGLRNIESINQKYEAGADIVVVGSAFEKKELQINQFK